ncbi:MAG: diadenylate cyclase CdaA [Eubacteriales bacterium]|jgi:diadenylate cyclase
MDFILSLVEFIISRITAITFFDILDIAIVSVVFYYIFKFVKDRRAGKLAVGVFFIIILLLLSDVFNMYALNFLLSNVVQVGIIGLMIVFQSELRYFLEKVGGNSFINSINRKNDKRTLSDLVKCIDAITDACASFSSEMVGALIVFERTTKLGDVIKTGTIIDAEPTEYLIKNIFFTKAPLHDGALVIRGCRLYSAGCFLPLSSNEGINKDLGTRHRAALGMSENSDAVVVVVSEETGTISTAIEGKLTRNYTPDSLRQTLITLLVGQEQEQKKENPIIRKFRH